MRQWKMPSGTVIGIALPIAFFGVALVVLLGIGLIHPRSALIPMSASDQSVLVDGARMRYRSQGNEGPVIIFLHGFGGSLEEWTRVVAKVPDARCYSVDLVGFGGSDRPLSSYSLEDQRRYLIMFMDALKIDRAVLAGRSMGASLAVWTAAKSKERVSGVLSVAPSGYPGSLRYTWPASWVYRPGWCNRFASFFVSNRLFGYFFPLSLARQGLGVTASYDERFARSLDEVSQPVMLVWSTGDKRVPYAYAATYRARLANARLRELPASAGHDAGWNDPDGVAAGLQELLGLIPSVK